MPDVATLPAPELADALRRRELSSRELLDHYLDRIERLNAAVNAVVTLDREGARRAANTADAALVRSDAVGPLHGLPMTKGHVRDGGAAHHVWPASMGPRARA